MPYESIPEEELKNRVAQDWFPNLDCTQIVGNIDFCVLPKKTRPQTELLKEQSLLWAEAKANKRDIIAMFAQLILTIGKARTFDKNLPPAFLGVFDAEKIAFISYDKVQHLFYKSDFNWNVTPSNHNTKEFSEIKTLINDVLEREKYLYYFGKDDKELNLFIKNNLENATEQKIHIDKNNFVPIYLRWLDSVKPLIDVDFEDVKSKYNILDSDFYLADLFVDDISEDLIDQNSIKEGLFVTFYVTKRKGEYKGNYEIVKENLVKGLFKDTSADRTYKLNDITKYINFWKRYKRPPIKEYHDYIIKRRDLLVPQDVRERKGAFFTPKRWVELSQKYIADVLGEDWQEEYYVWDCAAGTGNLLAGLTNKYNIWASTLDRGDVNVMHERINNGANLLKNHVFQFDFLNDEFSKLPQGLQEIINDPEKRKKLVIYINPPYAEERTQPGKIGKKDVYKSNIHTKYHYFMAVAARELFAQFLIRIYCEIPQCILANFSTLKNLQAPNFSDFRKKFRAKLEKIFLVPANTFDNVKGSFPIGFFVWNCEKEEEFKQIKADAYNTECEFLCSKTILVVNKERYISKWSTSNKATKNFIAFLAESTSSDFQHNKNVRLMNSKNEAINTRGIWISDENLIVVVIFLAIRHCLEATWLNDRDQFLHPNDSWQNDIEFHNDCLAFTLFHGQNRITTKEGENHWIPFTESEVNAQDKFASSFMSDFIAGKIKIEANQNNGLFSEKQKEWQKPQKRTFSVDATAVFDAGRELWKYYHAQKGENPDTQIAFNIDASLYDIREYFQGRNDKGKMNNKSTDQKYTELIGTLREKLKILANKIAVKVYKHGFLKD